METTREYPFESERLLFGKWGEEDEGLARQLWGSEEVTKLIGGPFNERQVAQKLEEEMQQYKESEFQYFPLFLKEDLSFVGCCGVKIENGEHFLGYHLLPPFWGRGLATEAARRVLRYAFDHLALPRLRAGHHPQNFASKNVLLKLHFVFVADVFYPPTSLLHPCYVL
eukprot:CAMPEP_0174262696 /NCGR_PEP_ID=MMETSP0439-20130205/14621_1 /TAXON_ID=0 /ORGANISM="Stereomyxa ramosa, Strain Chinc5" /LENGTH=167 /DNA_ID=CAMNT_0015347553 /DNA_START=36 /DNA_END=536 /DNA_ORIENTATION=-